MKVNINSKLQIPNNVKFTGFEVKKDEYGERVYSFSYPYDPKKYDCYLEAYPAIPNMYTGNYDEGSIGAKYKDIETGEKQIKLQPGENKLYLDYLFGRAENAPFAYHFKLQPKNNPSAVPIFKVDAGDMVDLRARTGNWENIFDIVVPESNKSGNASAATLICADNYDVRYIYDKEGNIIDNPNAQKGLNTFKNFSNHIGGTLAGVHKALREGRLDPYGKIFLLPHTSGDRTSAAGYWMESGFQFSSAVDSPETFAQFQNELFAKGKNLVADSALTSEGLGGIHIQSILQHGEDDVFFDWFKASSLRDMTAKIGAFGTKTEFVRHKLINAPEEPVQNTTGKIVFVKNEKYDKTQPTFVQVYNIDNATPEQVANPELKIDKYGNPNGSNPLKYGTHNDTVIAYCYPINFKTYKHNVEAFNELNSKRVKNGLPFVSKDSYEGTRVLTKFEKFEFENKIDGGFYTWDANVDIPKFDYANSNEDTEDAMHLPLDKRHAYFALKEQKRNEVLDYAVSSLKYWTRKTNQSLNLYVAQNLKSSKIKNTDDAYEHIMNLVDKKVLPQKTLAEVDKQVVENVLDGDYLLHGTDSNENFRNTILDGLMKYPLESTEAGKDILALFSTPYITNRATAPEYVGKSRFDLLKQRDPHLTPQYEDIYNMTTKMYTGAMYSFAQDVINDVNDRLPKNLKLNKHGDTSDYGKYVLPIITQEIAKYAVVKGLFPDVKCEINSKTGGIKYDYSALRKKSLKSLGIMPSSQKNEAKDLILKLRTGIGNISEKDKKQIADAVFKMIEDTDLKSFELAEMIVDRTKSGIDWRIDAAKDFSNMDGLRNRADTFEDNWGIVTNVLKNMTNGIKSENPNAYVVAEITDEVDLYKLGDGANSDRYTWEKQEAFGKPFTYNNDIVRKLIRESGLDAVANYSFYFTNVAAIFGKKGDDGCDWSGNDSRMDDIFRLPDESHKGAEGFLYSGQYDSIVKSYTFADNHDKPRINHILSLDMGLFFANLKNDVSPAEKDYRRRAFNVLHPEKETPNYNEDVHNYDFSYVSPMAVARGESLNFGFYEALKQLSNVRDDRSRDIIDPAKINQISYELKKIVAGFAAGRYNGQNFEPDNFGVEEVHKLVKLVVDEYGKNHKEGDALALSENSLNHLYKETFKQIMDRAMSNSLGIYKFLVNAPGIPTVYAGDELGSSGNDRKTKNVYLKNRSAIHHDWVNEFPFIKQRKDEIEGILMLRSRPALHALNDGAPYLLPKQYTNQGTALTALLRYAPDGNAVISLFNTSGITHNYCEYTSPDKAPVTISGNKIDLSRENDFIGLHGGLPASYRDSSDSGLEFINAYNPEDKYYLFKGDSPDSYYIAKDRDCRGEIRLTDNTLTLYCANDRLKKEDALFMKNVNEAKAKPNTSFLGRRTYVNETYNVAPVKYEFHETPSVGSKLAITCK